MGGRCSDGRCRHPDASGLEPAHSLDRTWVAGTGVGCSCLSRSLLADSNPRLGRAGDCVVLGGSERGLGREGAAQALETRSRFEQGTELSQVATTLL